MRRWLSKRLLLAGAVFVAGVVLIVYALELAARHPESANAIAAIVTGGIVALVAQGFAYIRGETQRPSGTHPDDEGDL